MAVSLDPLQKIFNWNQPMWPAQKHINPLGSWPEGAEVLWGLSQPAWKYLPVEAWRERQLASAIWGAFIYNPLSQISPGRAENRVLGEATSRMAPL